MIKRILYNLTNFLHIKPSNILVIDGIVFLLIPFLSKNITISYLLFSLGTINIILAYEFHKTLNEDMVFLSKLSGKPTLHINIYAINKKNKEERKAGIRNYFDKLPAGTYFFTTHEKMIRTIMGSAINQNIEPIIKSKEKLYIEDDNMSAIIQYKRNEMDPSFIIEGNKLPLKKIPFFKVKYIKK